MTLIDPLNDASGASDLYSLIYMSTATSPAMPEDLEALLVQSRANNVDEDITGMLLYRRGRFLQFLEGPETAVRALLDRIRADPRHTGIRVLLDGYSPERQLPDWTMGYERISAEPTPPPPGFRDTFDDLENADDTQAAIRALRELTLWFRVRAG
ncbi:BLUF domain-containing protein [Microbacterium dextranolyticum]|uniref:BLUF domain-containing protein n=1 Tax=Microbacterium dextranolyticum TaxID=36806 RepID=A0A9W6HM73_9MICO|nr:BLUF domain-containing protein [Microbacterium dextranolyticum]MBM7464280.1 hypothetical protein [Microbacterium dextranolyticum]GLJ95276.1 hypothetical protein GCM10017591_13380 [Microbacterium dextranolyticum]